MQLIDGGVFGPTGAAIVEITRGAQGDFFFAFFMIYFAFTSLFPADVRWILATSAAITASYVGARAFRPEGIVLDVTLTTNLLYLAELTFIGVVLNRVLCRLFFDEKRARIELAMANEALRELDQAKTGFFSNISHEIRTPLTLILTPVAHLLSTRGEALPSDVARKLEGVRDNAQRLLKMVNTLLDFAKLEAGQATLTVAELAPDDVVRYTAGLFAAAAEQKGVSFEVRCGAPELRMQSDLDKLEKILINLVGNALKFTPSGGRIVLSSRAEGRLCELSVADTGPGIAPEHQEAIFQRFVQIEGSSRASVRGTGIGLSMVREYARLLGGDVRLESRVGEGSTFTVALPATAAPRDEGARSSVAPSDEVAERAARDRAIEAADVVGREALGEERAIDRAGPTAPRVLVVDDNPALVRLVAAILEDEFNLVLASSGQEALDVLRERPVDLVVSDVMMPGISGLELCRRIKADPATGHLPVVLLTARGGTPQKVEGLEHGADDYLGKPFDPAELKARIRSLFDLRRTTAALAEKSASLEKALRQLEEDELKLVEAEKMRTLGELAAGVVHELDNAMNMVVNGALPLQEALTELRGGLEGEEGRGDGAIDLEEIEALARVVADAARSARSVIGELKGFAHQGSNELRPVDVNDVIQSTVRLYGKRPGLLVQLDLAPGAIVVQGVPSRLTQVFTNLVKNAHEAMPGGGSVLIATRRDEEAVVITVTDEGPGVPAERRSTLFEPFQTTKRQGVGLGLGLSLSRKVLRDHHGDVQLDEQHRPGARFVVRLPLAVEARPSRPSSDGSRPSVPAAS
jgi:signal transduction histidine kinase